MMSKSAEGAPSLRHIEQGADGAFPLNNEIQIRTRTQVRLRKKGAADGAVPAAGAPRARGLHPFKAKFQHVTAEQALSSPFISVPVPRFANSARPGFYQCPIR